LREDTRGLVIEGSGGEGARNGLYAFLERLGFGFFRDGEVIPKLAGPASFDFELEETPAFSLRGDMIWDNYLGPRRFCAGMWSFEDWERAILYVARNRMNFLEFYPPLEHVLALALPEANGLSDGSVFKASVKHDLAKRVLARGRSLGIRFMYVLSYGAFPEPVQACFPDLQWRNGFLCAHQPELMELTGRVWSILIDELGTDHWYAIRHRGEEDQPYSDPCRSVSKEEGYRQGFSVLEKVDAEAQVTVWTWGEELPELFAAFPSNVRAVHVRHGMANPFGDRGKGREQKDGAPSLPPGRKWLSAQFTVFGGNETLLQTPWSDASALARDASASLEDPLCEGFFQWPEWSGTSPWLSHAVAKIAWDPSELSDLDAALARYARARHADRADAFLAGFLPLMRDGNARFTYPPRKRLLVPYLLAPECRELLATVRAGAVRMRDELEGSSALYRRDFVDLVAWVGLRQAQVFEAEDSFDRAERTWIALARILATVPELSIVASASALSSVGELSARAEDSLWTLACDFYRGYPLVLSPEAIELVYLPQLNALRGGVLEDPGWFWHDFPRPYDADSVRKLPAEDAGELEREMRARLRKALHGDPPAGGGSRSFDPADVDAILSVTQ
jgi:hypothetical protein